MWLKLEFPLAGVAEKQESKGRGKRDRRLTALGLHKQKVCWFISAVFTALFTLRIIQNARPASGHRQVEKKGRDVRYHSTVTK